MRGLLRKLFLGVLAGSLLLGILGAERFALTPPAGTSGSNLAKLVRHDYDPVSDQVTFRVLDAENPSLGQSFTAPDQPGQICGFRMKIRCVGNPPDLRYRIGSRFGSDDIASGKISAQSINRFFEFFYGDDFSPKPYRPSEKYFIRLLLEGQTAPPAAYEIYGTTIEGENPANRDYGARTPDYLGGDALDSKGEPIARTDFAFEVFFTPERASRETLGEEPRFAFVKELLGGPHQEPLRDRNIKPGSGEFLLDDSWKVVAVGPKREVFETALADFHRYLEVVMETKPAIETVAHLGPARYRKAVIVGTKEQMPVFGSGLHRSESFHIDSDGERVIVCGFDERGVMRGLIYLEDVMNFKHAPILSQFRETRSPRLSPRITCAPFNTNADLDGPDTAYTDEVLSLISHYGFNAIWIWGRIHELGRSAIFPELGSQSAAELSRLNAIIERARKYGIEVYIYLSKDPLPEEFFLKHPEVRGNQARTVWRGSGFLMCTSAPKGQKYLEEATASIFRGAAGLKGIIFITGGEGLMHDHMVTPVTCPRCASRSGVEVVAELVATINRGAKRAKPDADVVVWPYTGGVWTRGDPADLQLIERLPSDVIWQANFETQQWIERDGVGDNIYDYSISYLGPADRFLKQAEAIRRRGLRLWAKTEYSISQEFVQTPYMPVPQRFAERLRRIAAIPEISGTFMNWQHYGFMPSVCGDIAKWFTWAPQPDIDDLLRKIARRDFGEGTEDYALQAWRHFSEAIAYYPFSGSTSRQGPIQKGPAHPMFFDPEYRPLHSYARSFSTDLLWTVPFGPAITAKYFRLVEQEWVRGVEALEKVVAAAQGRGKAQARRELGIARALLYCVRSTLNLIDFNRLRSQLLVDEDHSRAQQLLAQITEVAHRELRNAQDALPLIKADSRLGYANSGRGEQMGVGRGGIYTPQSIEKKIASLRRVLEVDLPNYRLKLRAPAGDRRERYYESEEEMRRQYDAQVSQLEHYLDSLLAKSPQVRQEFWKRNFSSVEAYQQSVDLNRQRLIQMIGGPGPANDGQTWSTAASGRTDRVPRRLLVAEEPDYTIYRMWFDALPAVETYGILLVPKNLRGRGATLICLHGLTGSPEQVCGLIEREDYLMQFGRRAVERGYVVFAPLMTKSVETKSRLDRKAIMVGTRLQWIEMQKLMRAIDYLRTLPEVDAERMGVYGISWGGRTSLYLAAVDQRIAAAVFSGHFNETVPKMVEPSPHYTAYILTREDYAFFPNLANRFSDSDVASLICPRPLFIEQGTRDMVVFYPLAQREFSKLKECYSRLGVADRAEMKLFDGEHVVYGKEAFLFLDKWLKPGK